MAQVIFAWEILEGAKAQSLKQFAATTPMVSIAVVRRLLDGLFKKRGHVEVGSHPTHTQIHLTMDSWFTSVAAMRYFWQYGVTTSGERGECTARAP